MFSKVPGTSGRGRARSRLLAVTAVCGTVAALAACGSSGSSREASTEGASKVTFSDTATFNEANPQSPTLEGAKLASVGAAPQHDGKLKVGILLKALTNQYWQRVEAGIEAAKARFQVDSSKVFSASSEIAQQEQLQICNTMVQQNFDAMIVSPETTSNLNPCLNRLKAKGIPIINIAAPGAGVTATVYAGPALLEEGEMAAGYLAKVLPKGSEVAHITGLPGSAAADLRIQGYRQGVKEAGLKSVAEVTGNWDEQTAFNRAKDLLGRHPNLAGIYAANDTMAVAVGRAVKQAGRAAKVKVVGTDGVPQAIAAIRSGEVSATVTPFPYYQGYWAVEAAARVLAGQKVPLWVKTADEIVDAKNVDQFFGPDGAVKQGLYD